MHYYAMERFLYRLSQSDYADSFILKGALALQTRKLEKFRPTMDIDISQRKALISFIFLKTGLLS